VWFDLANQNLQWLVYVSAHLVLIVFVEQVSGMSSMDIENKLKMQTNLRQLELLCWPRKERDEY